VNREEMLLEVWKTTVDVQKHFNELELRIRNFAVTVLAAFLAAAGFSVKESLQLDVWGREISLTGLVLLSGTFVWLAFYGMDRFWYHRLLKGAVDHGRTVEAALAPTLPEIGLTSAIGAASPITIGKFKFDSNRKMDWFYRGVAILLLTAAAIAFVQPSEQAKPAINATPNLAGLPAQR
jgi:hypothetical protein